MSHIVQTTDLENEDFMFEFVVQQFQLGGFSLEAGNLLLLRDQQRPQFTDTVVTLSVQQTQSAPTHTLPKSQNTGALYTLPHHLLHKGLIRS